MHGWPSFLDWVGELKGQMATMRVFHRAVCSFSKHCCQPAFTLCPFYSFQPSIAFRNKVYGQSSWENGLLLPFEGPGLRKLLCSKVSYVQVKLFSLSSFSTRTQTDYWSHKQTKEEGKSLTTMVGCGVQRPSKWFVSFLKQPFLALFHRHLHTVFFTDLLVVLEKRG